MVSHFFWNSRVCRFFGCIHLDDLRKCCEDATTVRWKSWYTVYSVTCFSFYMFLKLRFVLGRLQSIYRTTTPFITSLVLLVHVIATAKTTTNYVFSAYGSSVLLDFFRRSARFEVFSNFAPRRTTKVRVTWSYVARLAALVALLNAFFWSVYLPVTDQMDVDNTTAVQLLTKLVHVFATAQFYVYDSLHSLTLRPCCEVLKQYVRAQMDAFTAILALQDSRRSTAEAIETIRMNMCVIRDLKDSLNDVWKWSLVMSGVATLPIVGIGVSTSIESSFSGARLTAVLSYSVYTILDFVDTAILSQAMINEVSRRMPNDRTVLVLLNDKHRMGKYLEKCYLAAVFKMGVRVENYHIPKVT